jgi:hypothetical protein
MGAWGCGSFENDDALDWVIELEQTKDLSVIVHALDEIISGIGDYLDATDCANALAAAETVAGLAGRPGPALPEEITHWVSERHAEAAQDRQIVDETARYQARRAINAVLSESELKELWEETDDFEHWKATVTDLLERLG